MGTRATGTQCCVYKQTTKGHSQRYLKWKEDNQTLGFFNSTMATVVHFYIWKTWKIHTTYQESTITAVLQNVHQFISVEALLADERISTAERIMSLNLGTKTPEPTRSVKVTLNMKAAPIEIRINFLGKFAV